MGALRYYKYIKDEPIYDIELNAVIELDKEFQHTERLGGLLYFYNNGE